METAMDTMDTQTAGAGTARWISWGVSVFLALFLLFDGVARLVPLDAYVDGLVELGYPESVGPVIGLVLIACTLLYLVPRTAVLGAVLLTGYLGGAVASHLRIEEPNYLFALAIGVLLWAALYVRDPRVRAILGVRDAR